MNEAFERTLQPQRRLTEFLVDEVGVTLSDTRGCRSSPSAIDGTSSWFLSAAARAVPPSRGPPGEAGNSCARVQPVAPRKGQPSTTPIAAITGDDSEGGSGPAFEGSRLRLGHGRDGVDLQDLSTPSSGGRSPVSVHGDHGDGRREDGGAWPRLRRGRGEARRWRLLVAWADVRIRQKRQRSVREQQDLVHPDRCRRLIPQALKMSWWRLSGPADESRTCIAP